MKGSRRTQGTQTTSYGYGDWPQKVGIEAQDTEGVQSVHPAPENGETGMQESGSGLLDRILDKDNLNGAFKRVKSNGGSHGLNGMQVDELLPS